MPAKLPSTAQPARAASAPAARNPHPVLHRIRDRSRLDAIMDAISAIRLHETKAWRDIKNLAPKPRVDGIQAVPEGIFQIGEDGFAAAATAYVDLANHEGSRPGPDIESFPMQVRGRFDDDGNAVVQQVTIDTTSFYD